MSYRKIEVDGHMFEYSIGKTHTKIRGVGAYPNGEVGSIQMSDYCSCGSRAGNCDLGATMTLQVRPSDLAQFIKIHNLKVKSENKRR